MKIHNSVVIGLAQIKAIVLRLTVTYPEIHLYYFQLRNCFKRLLEIKLSNGYIVKVKVNVLNDRYQRKGMKYRENY